MLTTTNKAHVELFLNEKHRVLLPLPTSTDKYYEESIAETANDAYRVFDDTLGWAHAPWGSSNTSFPCFANNKGFRISEEAFVKREPAKKHYHIITIGNSFTHGDAVRAEDSWPYLLEVKTGKSVANLGVGGYGLQQALLRLMYSGITADTILFGAIWGDFERACEPVYTFYQGGNKTRPIIQFSNSHQDFSLVNVPVMRPEEFYASKKEHSDEIYNHIPGFNDKVFSTGLWTYSYFLRLIVSVMHQKQTFQELPIYLRDDGDLDQCVKIFEMFNAYCKQNNMYGEVILLDTGQNFWHKEKWQLDNPWELVSTKLKERGVPNTNFHAELFSAYKEKREDLIHPVENLHYSPAGNSLVADLLLQHLSLHNN